MIGEGVQLVGTGVAGAEPGEEVVRLGPADVPEMLDLTAGPSPARSCPALSSSASTWASAATGRWSPWPGNG